MTAPINPVPLANTSQHLSAAQISILEEFEALPPPIQGLDTSIVHIAPNGNITHLAGPCRGQEGVAIYQQLQGEQHLPFEQVLSESAFQWGATIERTNYNKRTINLRVVVYGQNTYQYQLCENRWWSGQDETADGWLGVFTRFTGWRWVPVRPMKTVDTTQKMDPVAYQNNLAIWDINWVCQRPWYSKPALFKTWSAKNATQNASGNYYGSVVLANQADMQTYVQYIINGAGIAIVQDNNSSTMVTLPPIFAADGPCLVDSDPQNRTLTASADPIDTLFYRYLQSSTVLTFLLGNITEQGEPWWQRGYARFTNSVPPETVTTFNVQHSNPDATITVVLQQRYKRSR